MYILTFILYQINFFFFIRLFCIIEKYGNGFIIFERITAELKKKKTINFKKFYTFLYTVQIFRPNRSPQSV